MTRLKVLLLTMKNGLNAPNGIVGDSPYYPFGDKEIEDYIELLSAANIPFDIILDTELSFKTLIDKGSILYTSIVLTVPVKQLAGDKLEIIKTVSHDFGISLIASYNNAGRATKELFGIKKIENIRYRFPCSIYIDRDKFDDKGIESEIKLGDGWKIPLQKYGLKRHPLRYCQRHLKKIWQQVYCYKKVAVDSEAQILATIKTSSDPALISFQYGRAINYYIALHSDHYLDRLNSLHRIVREIIRKNSGWGMVACGFEDSMVLRMDDPGTCERVYLAGYDTKLLEQADWREITAVLRKHKARLSVMYVPLWADDGNPDNGSLAVKGRQMKERSKGAIFSSKDVVFIKQSKNDPVVYDYGKEFLALQECLADDWLEIESHGLTHVDPDIEQWSDAIDRYSNFDWYHEFRHVPDNRDVSAEKQSLIMQQSAREIFDRFGVWPSSITPSGHEQSADSEQIAHNTGYKLFSSEYTSFKKNGLIIRNDKLQAIFLESTPPDAAFAAAGYPVVGVLHDYEIAQRGASWLDATLLGWQGAGIKRFLTLKEMAGYLYTTIEAYLDGNLLTIVVDISEGGDVADTPESQHFSSHPMALDITLPAGKQFSTLSLDGISWRDFTTTPIDDSRVKIYLPPFNNKRKQTISITMS